MRNIRCPLWVISGHSPAHVACPLHPQKQTSQRAVGVSALCQKQTHAPQQNKSLFNHIVGKREQLIWNGQAERFRRLNVDRQLKFSWLLDGNIARFRSA